jgi:uncharacterized repeat protein (TIGR02543 family)
MKARTLIASLAFTVFAASNLLHAQVDQIGGCDYRSGPSSFDGSEWYQYQNNTGHTINITVSWSDNYNSGGTSNAGDPGVPTTGNVGPGQTFWLATYSYFSGGPFYSVQRSFSYTTVSSPVTISWSTSTPTFNGSSQTGATATISPAGAAAVSGNSAIYAGNYTASASLVSSDYYWVGGQTTSVNWSIAKAHRNLNVGGSANGYTNTPYTFTATPDPANSGGTVTWGGGGTGGFNSYSWSASGTYTVSATISGDPNYQDASGSASISIGYPTTYSVTVNISPAAAASAGCSASASPPSGILDGGNTALSASAAAGWQFTGWTGDSTTATISGIHSNLTVTANFVPAGTTSASISASPSSATEPGATTVSWSTSNATSVSVSGNGVSSSAASGSQAVSGLPAGSYTYTVNASGPSDSTTQTATFTVNPAASVYGSISVSPTSASTPGATTVSWSTSNATSVSVSGNGVSSSAASGSQYVSGLSAGSYTYTLTAQGPGGPIISTATFTVSTAVPPSVDGSISVSPSTAAAPGATTVTWSTSNATSISVSGNGVNSTAASGSQAVSGLAAGSYSYTLTAQGPGGPITRTATFNVSAPAGLATIVIPPLPSVRGYGSPPTYPSQVDYVRINTPTPASSVSMTVIAPNGTALTPTVRNCQPDNNPPWYTVQSPWTIETVNKDMYYEPTIPPLPAVGTYKLQVTVTNSAGSVTVEGTGQAIIYGVRSADFNIIGGLAYTDTGTTDDNGDEIYLGAPQEYGWSLNPPVSYTQPGDKINYTITQGTVYRFLYWSDSHGILSYNPNFTYTSNGTGDAQTAWLTAVPPTSLTIKLGGTRPYDGTTATTGVTAAITAGSLNSGDTIGYSYTATPSANVGSYGGLVTATIRDAGNADVTWKYAITYTGSYAITPAVQTVTLSLTPLVSNYTVDNAGSPLNGKTYKRVWQEGGAWHAYLGRSGDQFQIVGQASLAVQAFELQALEPNAVPSAWYSVATIPPPAGSPNGPGVSVTGVFSVSLDTGSAAAALVPQSYVQGNPKTGVWQLRARTQDSSGTWSDWSNVVSVTVDLPLTTAAVPAQTLPPAGPIGGWFTASDQTTFKLPVWIP